MNTSSTILLWKCMKDGLKSTNGSINWKLGEWQKHDGELTMCEAGFHASEKILQAFGYVRPGLIARVEVRGEHISELVAPLKAAPGVLSVAAFGNAVHVAGQDPALLEAALAPLRGRSDLRIEAAQANLEDVFISLIASAPDNFAAQKVAA